MIEIAPADTFTFRFPALSAWAWLIIGVVVRFWYSHKTWLVSTFSTGMVVCRVAWGTLSACKKRTKKRKKMMNPIIIKKFIFQAESFIRLYLPT